MSLTLQFLDLEIYYLIVVVLRCYVATWAKFCNLASEGSFEISLSRHLQSKGCLFLKCKFFSFLLETLLLNKLFEWQLTYRILTGAWDILRSYEWAPTRFLYSYTVMILKYFVTSQLPQCRYRLLSLRLNKDFFHFVIINSQLSNETTDPKNLLPMKEIFMHRIQCIENLPLQSNNFRRDASRISDMLLDSGQYSISPIPLGYSVTGL